MMITKRKEKEVSSEEMEPPGNRVESYDRPAACEVEKNRSSEMMVIKALI